MPQTMEHAADPRHLTSLYQTSRLLLEQATGERALPEERVVAILANALAPRSVLLIEPDGAEAAGRMHGTLWHRAGLSPIRLAAVERRGRDAFAYLHPSAAARQSPLIDITHSDRGLRAPTEAEGGHTSPETVAGDDVRGRIVSLPLVDRGLSARGLLQVEMAPLADLVDLAFLGALANMLSVALDRERIYQREVEQRHRAEALERELRASVERERADAVRLRELEVMKAVMRFAGGLSHDLNNMLMVLIGYTSHLLEVTPSESPLRTAMKSIHGAAERVARLTQELLATSGARQATWETVDVRAALRALTPKLQKELGADVRLRGGAAAAPLTVITSRPELERTIIELAALVARGQPEGAPLTVRASRVVLAPEERSGPRGPLAPGVYARVTVRGAGGPEADLSVRAAQIFEPFSDMTEHGRGLGLELASIYGFVAQSGGAVEAAAAPARGGVALQVELLLPVRS